MQRNDALWDSVLKSLMQSYGVSEVHINTWLKPAKIESISATELLIRCNDKFQRDWIERKFLKLIKKILEEEFSINAAVRLFIDRTAHQTAAQASDQAPAQSSQTKQDSMQFKPIPGISPDMTFERFVPVKSNQFAYKAALAIAEGNFSYCNPLFIYGETGLGKTHLMSAVGNRLHVEFPKMNMIYIGCKDFMQDVLNLFAIKDGKSEQEKVVSMRERFSKVDLLMLDDIQLMVSAKSKEIFFDIFNALHTSSKQIIITSDQTPQQLDIDDRLRSRFRGGLLAAIEPSNVEEKVAILMKKAEEANITIEEDAALFLSENIKVNDVRSLEGVLKTSALKASLDNAPLSKDYILKTLKEWQIFKAAELFIPTIDALINAVTDIFKIKKADIYSHKRTKSIVEIRQITMYLLREKLSLSLKEVGGIFKKDHSTVSYAVNQMKKRLETDVYLLNEVLPKIMEKAREN